MSQEDKKATERRQGKRSGSSRNDSKNTSRGGRGNRSSSRRNSGRTSNSQRASTPRQPKSSREAVTMPHGKKNLSIIPLGGIGEIGKNMFAMQYEDDILLIDGGLAFPDADMLGVDILVPKIDWVIDNADKIKGWVITHGHEDHIGGLPYMIKQLPKIPMYGAKLTLGLLRGKFDEFNISESDVNLNEISPDGRVKISKFFTVDFFRMTHSIPDNSGLIIHTPIGRIVHSGDFKLDYHPADNKTSHLHKLAEAGRDGVLLLISDSTRAESPGHTPSERDVANAIEDIVRDARGRVVVTTFASHVHRVQNVIRIAEKYDRRVVVEGRSMVKYTKIAQELGYLEVKQPLVNVEDIGDLQDDKVLFLCTGSQGQPMAALARLAAGTHRRISLRPGDTVIMSSHPIPGNEEAVGRVINQLYQLRVNLYYPPAYKVHASGHASQDELKLMLDLTRPKYFLPWHGEMRHLINHKRLAATMAHPPEKTMIAQNGDMISLGRDSFERIGEVESGVLYIDNVEEISEPIIRDRQALSVDGVIVIMALAGNNPAVEVITRGVTINGRELRGEVERIALENLKKGIRGKRNLGDIRDDIFYPVRRYVRKATGRNPLIVPTVVEG